MSEQQNRVVIERGWRAMVEGDWNGVLSLYHDDAELVWPQTGETIRGKDNCVAVLKNYPGGLPTGTLRRITSSGDVAILEATMKYPDGSTWHQSSIFELRDGRVVRETDYWAPEMEAPEWRSQWVTRAT